MYRAQARLVCRCPANDRLMAKDNRSVLKTLVIFSAVMVAFPIATFFVLHDYVLVGEKSGAMFALHVRLWLCRPA